jgi:hypothetical protein
MSSMPGSTHLPVASMTRGQSVVVEGLRRDHHDMAVADADIAHRRRCAGAIEPAAVANDGVVGHQVIEQRVLAGVNEIGEQIRRNVYFRC